VEASRPAGRAPWGSVNRDVPELLCVPTIQLANGNRSTDGAVMARNEAEGRVLVSDGIDFADSHFPRGTLRRLLLVSSGNVTNATLMALSE
jgi:predicted nuclease of predicted toxin-antitoxin system